MRREEPAGQLPVVQELTRPVDQVCSMITSRIALKDFGLVPSETGLTTVSIMGWLKLSRSKFVHLSVSYSGRERRLLQRKIVITNDIPSHFKRIGLHTGITYPGGTKCPLNFYVSLTNSRLVYLSVKS